MRVFLTGGTGLVGREIIFQTTCRIDTPVEDKEAISHVQLVGFDDKENVSTLSVNIETGRKHQTDGFANHRSPADCFGVFQMFEQHCQAQNHGHRVGPV